MLAKGIVSNRQGGTQVNSSKALSSILFLLAVITTALFWFMTDVVPSADAHGTAITYTATFTVQGHFEGGDPMANAEVSVFTPDDPENAWEQGIADDEGRYTFTTVSDKPGDWAVSYRSAGHGDIAYIPVGTGVASPSGLSSGLQRAVMAAAVIWGFVGTALYFQARQKADS